MGCQCIEATRLSMWQRKNGPTKSLERTRAGHVSCQCGRTGPSASLSSGVMRHRKVIVAVILLVLAAGLAVYGLPRRQVLAWKVVSIEPREQYWVRDHMEQHCWRVEIEVTNLSPSEIIVDWNRDESAFQIGGRWENLGTGALMPYLGPSESRTFSVYVPERAQACRLLMHYEQGPFWSKADQFLKDHGTYVPDKLFARGMKLNQKLPGHYRRLNIEVKIPTASSRLDETKAPRNHALQRLRAAGWRGSHRRTSWPQSLGR